MNRIASLAVLLALIALLGGMFYQVISPFLLPLFLAAVMAVICQPLQNYFLKMTGGRRSIAAAMTTIIVTLIVVGPLVIVTFVTATNLYDLADQRMGRDWRSGLDLIWQKAVIPGLERVSPMIPGGLSEEKLGEWGKELSDNMRTLATRMAGTTFSIASSTVGMFVSLAIAAGMFLTALYYFLADGPAILAAAEELIPLPVDHQRRLADRFASTVRAVVTATFAASFAQGVATTLALQVCGFGHFLVFLVVGSIASLIPLAGAWMVWGPCAIWLALQGHWAAAAGLTIWGIAVVGMLDNIVKMHVLKSDAELHPLIAFISVIGALQVMGLWGIFIGPIVASCLYALVQIFNIELKEMAKEREAASMRHVALNSAGPPTGEPIVPASVNTPNGPPVHPQMPKRARKRGR
jgi:predicted PurR-regulated permease PerM